MNIVAILANGVGARFGSNIPKQFHKINGKMIIEYVVEAISTAKSVDKIVVVTNVEANKGFLSGLLQNEKVVLTDGGSTRNLSLKNALEFVIRLPKTHCLRCRSSDDYGRAYRQIFYPA